MMGLEKQQERGELPEEDEYDRGVGQRVERRMNYNADEEIDDDEEDDTTGAVWSELVWMYGPGWWKCFKTVNGAAQVFRSTC
ncbi:hypothetical protein BY996DRAFT_6527011 [Phakopsora pachyrhizi]|nr:hypothetical protein BY996DRAFT_6527011 [Phakopsora pachyrhizi]